MAKISINIKQGTLKQADAPKPKQDIIVGIDLGTTNSLVAYMDAKTGQPTAIQDAKGSNKLVPSIIHFDLAQEGNIRIGTEALPFLTSEPQNTIYSVKRLMGKAYKDISNYAQHFGYQVIDDDTERLVKIRVSNKFYTPIELSSFILRQLKARAEQALEQTIGKAVITVPAYFNDAQRQATRDAGKLAGLEVLRIVNEPTAASLAYGIGLQAEEAKTIAVYDLGGGTFDISILSIDNGIFEVLSTNGNTFLGGDDFDRAIVNHWLSIFKDEKIADVHTLRLLAESAKKHLSENEIFSQQINDKTYQLTRSRFNQLIEPLVEQTITSCQQALRDAQLSISDIDEVVMVGGSTRVPLVQNSVAQFFQKTVNNQVDPDEVVALGAAIQADILAGNNKDLLLLDITPLSLGIETMGGLMDVIIPRNSKVPTKAGRQYTTQVDGQRNMKIAVYQGERDLVQHNRKLGEFDLKGIPGMPAGLPKIQISFLIDADGILRVKAQELRSGVVQQIKVRPQYGLSEEEMAQMLLDSMQHAQDDMAFRALQEAINEGKHITQAAEKFVAQNADFFQIAEIEHTQSLIDAVKNALQGTNKDLIHKQIEALNAYTKPFAHRVMDAAVAKAMKGKQIAE